MRNMYGKWFEDLEEANVDSLLEIFEAEYRIVSRFMR
jgi:hypothetical protein